MTPRNSLTSEPGFAPTRARRRDGGRARRVRPLGAAGGGFAGYAIGAATAGRRRQRHRRPAPQLPVLRAGAHQGGIATPPQRYCVFMSFSLGRPAPDAPTCRRCWLAGRPRPRCCSRANRSGAVQPQVEVQPPGRHRGGFGLSPASLTVTIGLGPSVFGDRFGLAAQRPAVFADLPPLNGDNLDPRLHGGDLSVQACADDPQVCYHAVRNLARLGRNIVSPFWAVLGFGRASAGPGQAHPAKSDGIQGRNPQRHAPTSSTRRFVWVDNSDQAWMNGGTYQVVRKIRMLLETWDTDRIGNQQTDLRPHQRGRGAAERQGRVRHTGLRRQGPPTASRVIDPLSHVGLAARENNDGVMIRRRSYNYTDGLDPNGQLNAGLLFISYQNDPQNFIRLQNRLGRQRPAQRVHPPHRLGDLRGAARTQPRATTSGSRCSAEQISPTGSGWRPPARRLRTEASRFDTPSSDSVVHDGGRTCRLSSLDRNPHNALTAHAALRLARRTEPRHRVRPA